MPTFSRAFVLGTLSATVLYVLAAVHFNWVAGVYRVTRSSPWFDPETLPLLGPDFAAAGIPPNTLLRDGVEHIAKGEIPMQETVLVQPYTGNLYLFGVDGWLYTIPHPDTVASPASRRVWYVGGRVLGAAFADENTILACDVAKGLVKLDLRKQSMEVLSVSAPNMSPREAARDGGSGAGGGGKQEQQQQQQQQPIHYIDDLDIAEDGTVYFSDASDMRPYMLSDGQWTTKELSLLDFYRGYGTGRLMSYNPSSGETTTLLSGIHFANGVAVSQDGSFVLVAETFRMRILRYWLSGKRAGGSEVFAELPCVPDGISRAKDGGFYVACPAVVTPPFALAGRLAPLRWLLGNLPSFLWPETPNYGLVIKLHSNGAPAFALHDAGGKRVHFVTAVTEVVESESGGEAEGWLYLGQLRGDSVPRVRIPSSKAVQGVGK